MARKSIDSIGFGTLRAGLLRRLKVGKTHNKTCSVSNDPRICKHIPNAASQRVTDSPIPRETTEPLSVIWRDRSYWKLDKLGENQAKIGKADKIRQKSEKQALWKGLRIGVVLLYHPAVLRDNILGCCKILNRGLLFVI